MDYFFLRFAAVAVMLGGCAVADREDVGKVTAAVCCGANCCNVGGTCFARGEANPANMCEMCDPSASQFSFTAVPGCVFDAGSIDAGGSTGTDAGDPGTDAGGSTGSDAGGSTGSDAGGSTGSDAGPGTPPPSGGGDDGGCSIAAVGHGGSPLAALVLVLVVALGSTRRRRH